MVSICLAGIMGNEQIGLLNPMEDFYRLMIATYNRMVVKIFRILLEERIDHPTTI